MTDRSDLERNVALIRRHFDEFINRKDLTAVERNFSADFLDHDPPGGTATLAEGVRLVASIFERFPDFRVELSDIVAQDDKVAVRSVWSGHEKESGQLMEFHGFTLWRVAEGKLAERWGTTTAMRAVEGETVAW